MSEKTEIAWTDSTVNDWSGCTKVSAGCKECYAETRDKRHMIEPVDHWGKGAPRLKHVGAVKQALALNRKPWVCDECGTGFETNIPGIECISFHRRRIFSLSLGDWLDDEVPVAWQSEKLDTMRQCDQVTWILCTKRPENFAKILTKAAAELRGESAEWIHQWLQGNPPKNILLLTSVENQEAADTRIPELLKIPAACRGLSLEPLLGEVKLNLSNLTPNLREGIGWLILGGESGATARPCNVGWIRSLVNQGRAAGVATFVKQLGSLPELGSEDAQIIRHKKGGDMDEWPADLQIQEFPRFNL